MDPLSNREVLMFALGCLTAFPAGWSFARIRMAYAAARANREETDRVIVEYPKIKDGRNTNNYPEGDNRYGADSER